MNNSPKFQVAVVMVIVSFDGQDLKVALYKRERHPFEGQYSLPAGLVTPTESVDEAARRVLKEKTGMERVYLEQLHTFGDVKRDPVERTIGTAYFALVPYHEEDLTRQGARWESIEKVKITSFDHQKIVEFAISYLRDNILYSNIVSPLLHAKFTLSELQKVYEVILGKSIDKRNFRKKILSSGILKKAEGKLKGKKQRPAQLFEFTETAGNISLL